MADIADIVEKGGNVKKEIFNFGKYWIRDFGIQDDDKVAWENTFGTVVRNNGYITIGDPAETGTSGFYSYPFLRWGTLRITFKLGTADKGYIGFSRGTGAEDAAWVNGTFYIRTSTENTWTSTTLSIDTSIHVMEIYWSPKGTKAYLDGELKAESKVVSPNPSQINIKQDAGYTMTVYDIEYYPPQYNLHEVRVVEEPTKTRTDKEISYVTANLNTWETVYTCPNGTVFWLLGASAENLGTNDATIRIRKNTTEIASMRVGPIGTEMWNQSAPMRLTAGDTLGVYNTVNSIRIDIQGYEEPA